MTHGRRHAEHARYIAAAPYHQLPLKDNLLRHIMMLRFED